MADGDSVKLDKWSGLRNTVSPERLGPNELARARDIDLDDAGQPHRRRGYNIVRLGAFHSAFTTAGGITFVVQNGVLVQLLPDYSVVPVQAGITGDPLCFAEVGPRLFASSRSNSFQVDLATLAPAPWGMVQEPNHRPGLQPGPSDFWLSPVVNPLPDLPPLKGKLLGAPLPCSSMAYWNGRIYMAVGATLWATELFLYNYVDRNAGFRQYEHPITVVAAVEDGLYVGTEAALFFVSGRFGEDERRVTKLRSRIVPGSAVNVPADMIAIEARSRPDLPIATGLAVSMMSDDGMLLCMAGGEVVNMTRAVYAFPHAERSAALWREQDGMHTVVQAMRSSGTPSTEQARFGDYCDARIIRASAATSAQAGIAAANDALQSGLDVLGERAVRPSLIIEDIEGNVLGEA